MSITHRTLFFSVATLLSGMVAGLLYFGVENTTTRNTSPEPELSSSLNKSNEKIDSNIMLKQQKLAYQVTIHSNMTNASNEKNSTVIRFNLALKPVKNDSNQPTLLLGRIDQITANSLAETTNKLPKFLTFTVNYQNGHFHNIDLLQLPENHPLTITKTVLTQLSYNQYKPLQLQLADGVYTFQYTRHNLQVQRKTTHIEYNAAQASTYHVLSQSDQWDLHLQESLHPSALKYETFRQINYNDQVINIDQSITIDSIQFPRSFDDSPALYTYDANKHHTLITSAQDKQLKIENNTELMSALTSFTNTPDIYTISAIGQYAAQHAGLTFVEELLLNSSQNDTLKSALIFALEQSGVPEANNILSAIILNEAIDEKNRLRAITSIAKLGDVTSDLALNTLQQMTRIDNQTIADTALLNVGILGDHAKHLTNNVTDFLHEQLQKTDNSNHYITLLAVNNLKTSALNQNILPFINSEHYEERMIAARILTRDKQYQSKLFDHLLTENNPSVAGEIIDVYLSQKSEITLSKVYQSKLIHRMNTTSITPLREKYEVLYNTLNEQ
ncbi:HEAT repeat domain-containing protein [Zooshikella harenae]|uniref:HEAT repeat domain-containing protein n=1 Tax=Zooshikella harenae TaxID=2827238 RepID=A0ABS5ZE88_9GAMM|nr:HEAT repeat domain-containing protein [Zooshikella harenae]MBU2711585.1 HEAT repeat domain-containing protein [Zooshikella harenae]